MCSVIWQNNVLPAILLITLSVSIGFGLPFLLERRLRSAPTGPKAKKGSSTSTRTNTSKCKRPDDCNCLLSQTKCTDTSIKLDCGCWDYCTDQRPGHPSTVCDLCEARRGHYYWCVKYKPKCLHPLKEDSPEWRKVWIRIDNNFQCKDCEEWWV